MRLVALGAAVVALVGGVFIWALAAPAPTPRPVALMWTDQGLGNIQVQAGFDRAVTNFGLQGQKYTNDGIETALQAEYGENFWEGRTEQAVFALWDREQQDQMRRVADRGAGLIMLVNVGMDMAEPVIAEYPEVRFLSDQPSSLPNVATLTFVDSEASYVAGAAAALTTESGVIGYIGGVDWHGIWGFQAGYEAGARSVNPEITVLVDYLSTADDFGGFQDVPAARETALEMYRDGADVILHAAGDSGLGLFEAATEYSRTEGRHVWAIGVDSDQYETVSRLPGATDAEAWQAHILTSVLKGLDQITTPHSPNMSRASSPRGRGNGVSRAARRACRTAVATSTSTATPWRPSRPTSSPDGSTCPAGRRTSWPKLAPWALDWMIVTTDAVETT